MEKRREREEGREGGRRLRRKGEGKPLDFGN